MIPLAIAVAVLLQQQVPPRTPPSEGDFTPPQAASRQAIMDVGHRVAEVRSGHDLLRRAAFNLGDAMVVQRTQELQRNCQGLRDVARAAVPRLCRNCFGASTQRAIDAYRGVLPGVSRLGVRCTTRLAQFLRAKVPAAEARRGIGSVTRTLVEGLAPYEARLEDVRRSFGLVGGRPAPAPRR